MDRFSGNISVETLVNETLGSRITLNPPYQRKSGRWNISRQSDFVGSLFNSFSPGVIYFHQFPGGQDKHMVDGKQRTSTLIDFYNGYIRLPENFTYRNDPSIDLSRMNANDIRESHPDIYTAFMSEQIPFQKLVTNNIELIHEQFILLNSAKAVVPSEIRHAFRGDLMDWVRQRAHDVQGHHFITTKLGFKNDKFQYEDVLIKLLYIEINERFMSLTKSNLDNFAKKYSSISSLPIEERNAYRNATRKVEQVLTRMHSIFGANNGVFNQITAVPLYYWLIRNMLTNRRWTNIKIRNFFEQFIAIRKRHQQGPDAYENPALSFYASKNKDGFTRLAGYEERYAILKRFSEVYLANGDITVETTVNINDLTELTPDRSIVQTT